LGQYPKTALALFFFGVMGCGSPKEEEVTPTAEPRENEGAAPQRDEAKLKELKRIEQEVRDAVAVKDWTSARQIIESGLKLSENRIGLELQVAELLLLRGDVERETGNEMEASRYYTDAMAVFHVQKSDRGRFETLLGKSQLEASRGDYAAATRELEEAATYLPKLKDRTLVGKYKMIEGRLVSRQVKHQEAYDALLEAIQIFEASKDHTSRAEALLLLAAEEDMLGQFSASKQSLDKALALFSDKEDLDGKVRALHRLAAYAEREKKYAKARQLLKEVLELYEQLDQKSAAANVRRHLNSLPMPESGKKKK
jgi:tetratricopeptide (TPR) repeat protein